MALYSLATRRLQDSYQFITQVSKSAVSPDMWVFADGLGDPVYWFDGTASFAISASYALSASWADTAGFALSSKAAGIEWDIQLNSASAIDGVLGVATLGRGYYNADYGSWTFGTRKTKYDNSGIGSWSFASNYGNFVAGDYAVGHGYLNMAVDSADSVEGYSTATVNNTVTSLNLNFTYSASNSTLYSLQPGDFTTELNAFDLTNASLKKWFANAGDSQLYEITLAVATYNGGTNTTEIICSYAGDDDQTGNGIVYFQSFSSTIKGGPLANHAEGEETIASGDASHAEGKRSQATSVGSHAEGLHTISNNSGSHAEGRNTVASGDASHAEGSDTVASGNASHASGYSTLAIGDNSTAIGFYTSASGEQSLAVGYLTKASGVNASAFGRNTIASGLNSIAIGQYTVASGTSSFAAGYDTTASGNYANSFGETTVASGTGASSKGWNTQATGPYSHAEGFITTAAETGSHAEGGGSNALGLLSHAEGSSTTAIGTGSHAEGYYATAIGNYSHAEGSGSIASGSYSHAEGELTLATGQASHASGYATTASGTYSRAAGLSTIASGLYAHAEGELTLATGQASHAEGALTTASGQYNAHAEGYATWASGAHSHAEGFVSLAAGLYSHAEGSYTYALGAGSHAEGTLGNAVGFGSHAEGFNTLASGSYSHAEGYATTAKEPHSHAEGSGSIASGEGAHAEGKFTVASGAYSHAEGSYTSAFGYHARSQGSYTNAIGINSFAGGSQSVAYGDESVALGLFTIASGSFLFPQTAVGRYNLHSNTTDGFVVGIGTSNIARADGFGVGSTRMYASNSIFFPNLTNVTKPHMVVYDSASGQLFYADTSSGGGGGGSAISFISNSTLLTSNLSSLVITGSGWSATNVGTQVTLSFAGGGSGTPGGSSSTIQFNDAGTFSGSNNYTFNKITNLLRLTGSMIVSGAISASFGPSTVGFVGTSSWSVSSSRAVSALSSSYATTASRALVNILTASIASNIITFTKGDGTSFPITVPGSSVTVQMDDDTDNYFISNPGTHPTYIFNPSRLEKSVLVASATRGFEITTSSGPNELWDSGSWNPSTRVGSNTFPVSVAAAKPILGLGAKVSIKMRGIFLKATNTNIYMSMVLSGSAGTHGDVFGTLYSSATLLVPAAGDVVTHGAHVWNILTIDDGEDFEIDIDLFPMNTNELSVYGILKYSDQNVGGIHGGTFRPNDTQANSDLIGRIKGGFDFVNNDYTLLTYFELDNAADVWIDQYSITVNHYES